jgi:hypothetical protein
MTETTCVISTQEEGDNEPGSVGAPNPSCGKVFYLIKALMIRKGFKSECALEASPVFVHLRCQSVQRHYRTSFEF